jgi:hypothetical protein
MADDGAAEGDGNALGRRGPMAASRHPPDTCGTAAPRRILLAFPPPSVTAPSVTAPSVTAPSVTAPSATLGRAGLRLAARPDLTDADLDAVGRAGATVHAQAPHAAQRLEGEDRR